MGTNYYLTIPKCEHCNAPETTLHIGKLSAGWVFALHAIPERKITGLVGWHRLFMTPNVVITNEYGKIITRREMLNTIRHPYHSGNKHHPIDEYCIANRKGYDVFIGDFC